jgi:uncharacterized protein YkwD
MRRLAALAALTSCATLVPGASADGDEPLETVRAKGSSSCSHAHARPAKLSHHRARDAIVCLINRKRGRHGLAPVSRDRRLRRAAQRHNRRLNGTGCWSHRCPGEAKLEDRMRNVGYVSAGLRFWKVGENIARSVHRRVTPTHIVNAWMHSPGHRRTILTPEYRDVGVAFNRGAPSSKRAAGVIYTTDFGVRIH